MFEFDLSLVLKAIFLVLGVVVFAVLLTMLIMGFTDFLVKKGVIKKEESLAYSDFFAKMLILIIIIFALIYSYLSLNKPYQPISINRDSLSRELILPWKECLNNSKPYYLTGQIIKPNESNIYISYF